MPQIVAKGNPPAARKPTIVRLHPAEGAGDTRFDAPRAFLHAGTRPCVPHRGRCFAAAASEPLGFVPPGSENAQKLLMSWHWLFPTWLPPHRARRYGSRMQRHVAFPLPISSRGCPRVN